MLTTLRAQRLLKLIDAQPYHSTTKLRELAHLPRFLPSWTCPSCDEKIEDADCECFEIMDADRSELRDVLEDALHANI